MHTEVVAATTWHDNVLLQECWGDHSWNLWLSKISQKLHLTSKIFC